MVSDGSSRALYLEWQRAIPIQIPAGPYADGSIAGPGIRASADTMTADRQGRLALAIGGVAARTAPKVATESLNALTTHGATRSVPWSLVPDASIIILDAPRQRVVIRGDRYGRTRVYYRVDSGRLFAGTEFNAVAPESDQRSVSRQAIFDYVYFHAIPAPRSIDVGVSVLPIGAALVVDRTSVRVEVPPASNWSTTESDPAVAGNELLKTLRTAVSRSIPADESEVACFLSGGLDSSSVAGLAAERLGGQKVHAFSIGFAEPRYDESEFAGEAARHFNLNWHRHELGPDEVAESLDDIIAAMPEPFGNSSAVAVYHCARQARRAGFRHMLAGDGGDEVFGGNSRYAKQLVFQRYFAIPGGVRRWIIEPGIHAASRFGVGLARKASSYVTQAKVPLPDRLQSYNYLHRHPAHEVFTDTFLRSVDVQAPIRLLREEYESCASSEAVNRMLQLDWRFTLHDNDLVKVNSMCGAVGVDASYPMLDHDLVAFGCSLPASWKVRRGELRWLYRRALRGTLPDMIIDKTKHGFGLPFGVWTQTHEPLRTIVEDALSGLERRGVFRPSFLADTRERHRTLHASYYGELVWVLTVLELWMRKNAPGFGS